VIKLIFLMRRKPGVTREAFFDYWLHEHPKLVLRHAETLKVRRYVQSHAVGPEWAVALRPEWDDSEPWDGLTEVWIDDLEALKRLRGNPDMDRIQAELVADEQTFVDLETSTMFVAVEHEIIPFKGAPR
jgi:hypothetical protein